MLTPVIQPYPWRSLEPIPRACVSALRSAHESLDGLWDPGALCALLGELVGETIELLTTRVGPSPGSRPLPRAAACLMQSPDREQRVLLECEPELAATLLARLVGRRTGWIDRDADVPASVQGALGALALTVARRTARRDLFGLAAVGPWARELFVRAAGESPIAIDVTVLVAGEAYRACVHVCARPKPTSEENRFDCQALAALGPVSLQLPVVAGLALLPSSAFGSLRVGDAVLASDGWRIRRQHAGLSGAVVLCAPKSERGLRANLRPSGEIVVLEGTMSVEADANAPQDDNAAQGADLGSEAADALAEAPLVVRVELGAVTLSARQWASLRPGDVLATGNRIGERAVLRIGGHEVARGELVDVDGELGVRIHELIRSNDGGSR